MIALAPSPQAQDLGDNLWMNLEGFVPAYNLVLKHARELGLSLADVGLILQIMRLQADEVLHERRPCANLRQLCRDCQCSYSYVRERVADLAARNLLTIEKRRGLADAYNFTPLYQRCWCYVSPKNQKRAQEQIEALPPVEREEQTAEEPTYPRRPRGRPRRNPAEAAPLPMIDYQATPDDARAWYWTQRQTEVFNAGQKSGFPDVPTLCIDAGAESWGQFVNDASPDDLHKVWLMRHLLRRAAM